MTTILQISDLHLLSQPTGTLKGVPTAESAALVLQHARATVPDPAWVVLSGDLSHEETVAGYELLHDLLGDWAARCLLIPGNHDDRAKMRQVFRQVPGAGEEPIWFRQELAEWALLGIDTHVPGEVYGEVSGAMLEQFETLLSADPSRPALVFLHHHPGPVGSNWVDSIGLRNAAQLETRLARFPSIQALFCGHIHQVFAGRIGDVPFHSAPSTAIQFLPNSPDMGFDLQPPGFRVIELDERQFSTRVVRLDHLPFTPRAE